MGTEVFSKLEAESSAKQSYPVNIPKGFGPSFFYWAKARLDYHIIRLANPPGPIACDKVTPGDQTVLT